MQAHNLLAYMDWGYGHKKENIPEEMLTSKTPKLVSEDFD
jgi:hypothetical protein